MCRTAGPPRAPARYNYHGVGPGYNYLGTVFTVSPTASPLSCQYAGIWTARTRKIANERRKKEKRKKKKTVF